MRECMSPCLRPPAAAGRTPREPSRACPGCPQGAQTAARRTRHAVHTGAYTHTYTHTHTHTHTHTRAHTRTRDPQSYHTNTTHKKKYGTQTHTAATNPHEPARTHTHAHLRHERRVNGSGSVLRPNASAPTLAGTKHRRHDVVIVQRRRPRPRCHGRHGERRRRSARRRRRRRRRGHRQPARRRLVARERRRGRGGRQVDNLRRGRHPRRGRRGALRRRTLDGDAIPDAHRRRRRALRLAACGRDAPRPPPARGDGGRDRRRPPRPRDALAQPRLRPPARPQPPDEERAGAHRPHTCVPAGRAAPLTRVRARGAPGPPARASLTLMCAHTARAHGTPAPRGATRRTSPPAARAAASPPRPLERAGRHACCTSARPTPPHLSARHL